MTSVRQVEVGEFTEEQIRVHRAGEALHRDGASPAGALELLAAIIEDRTWERVADAKGRPFRGFRAFVEARAPFGLGYDPDQLPKVLELRHPRESVPDVECRMLAMREQIRTLLLSEIPTAPTPGGDHRSPEFQKRGTLLKPPQSDTTERTVRRLKRDDPALAEKVVRGEVTPNAAAREKGWRKPRVVLSSPERIAVSLRRYMPREALLRLAELIVKEE